MSQNSTLTTLKNKYEKLTVSETKNSRQSQESYYVKKQSQVTIPSFKTLITSRCKTSQTQQDRSPKTTTRRTQHTNYDVSDRLMPRSEEILQIYDEFEKNYDNVKMLNSNNFAQLFYNDQSIIQPTQQIQSNPQISYQSSLAFADLNYYMKLSILRFRFQYYRIKIKNKESPIQITFQSSVQQTNNLRSYFSMKIEFPTKFNADYQITTKSIRIFTNDNGHLFSEEYLYMTLYSQTDFQCTVIVTFGYERQRNATKSVKQDFIQEEDYIPRKRKQKMLLKQPPDLKLQNLLNPETLEQLKSQRQIKQQRVRLAGKSITEERQLDMKSKLFVKDQIIQYREVEKLLKQKVTYRTALQKIWLKTIFSTIFFNHLHYLLQCQRQHVRVEARGKLLVWQFKTKSLISVKDFGETPEQRTLFKTNMLLNVHCNLIKKQQQKKAKEIMTQFMQSVILTISILNKHQSWINKIIYIQKNYRNMKNKRRVFKEKIWRLIKEEFDGVVHDLIQMKGINNNFYEYEEKPHLHLDTVLMFQILEEYASKKKKIWQKFIHDTYVVNNPRNRLINLAINFRVPQLFQLPNELEIREIIEKYAIIKKLI